LEESGAASRQRTRLLNCHSRTRMIGTVPSVHKDASRPDRYLEGNSGAKVSYMEQFAS
jgi:hypothetical protein